MHLLEGQNTLNVYKIQVWIIEVEAVFFGWVQSKKNAITINDLITIIKKYVVLIFFAMRYTNS